MKKFRVTKQCDYVTGHLRYGHFEGIIEAESKEEIEKMFSDNDFDDFDDLDLVVDSYRVDDYELSDKPMKIEEVENEEKVGMPLDEYIKSLEASCERHVEACHRLEKAYNNAIKSITLVNDNGLDSLDSQYEYWHKKMMESEQDEH